MPAALPARADGIVIRDARGQDVAVGKTERVWVGRGAVTEILYALGLEGRVVGVDATSIYPSARWPRSRTSATCARCPPRGVLGLNPQLIIAIETSGPKETSTC